jgi:hypothetical protein
VEQIGASLDGTAAIDEPLLEVARRAVATIEQLVDDEARESAAAAAAALLARLGSEEQRARR